MGALRQQRTEVMRLETLALSLGLHKERDLEDSLEGVVVLIQVRSVKLQIFSNTKGSIDGAQGA